jgi:hypothetical protein
MESMPDQEEARFSDEARVPEPEDPDLLSVEDTLRAFRAIKEDDIKAISEMVENEILRLCHLKSGKVVDDKGRNLFEYAAAVNNRRVLNYFRNQLKAGPTFHHPNPGPLTYKQPYLTPMSPEIPKALRPTPAHGVNPRVRRLVESKAPPTVHVLAYPEIPSVLTAGKQISHIQRSAQMARRVPASECGIFTSHTPFRLAFQRGCISTPPQAKCTVLRKGMCQKLSTQLLQRLVRLARRQSPSLLFQSARSHMGSLIHALRRFMNCQKKAFPSLASMVCRQYGVHREVLRDVHDSQLM